MKTQVCLTPHGLLNRNETHTVTGIRQKPGWKYSSTVYTALLCERGDYFILISTTANPTFLRSPGCRLHGLLSVSLSALHCANPQCQEQCAQASWHLADFTSNSNEEEGGEAAGGLLWGRMGSGPAGQVPEESGCSSL